ncbi:maintenance of mitochondrial morphology protein 1 [Metschnikowia bicuspidata var. bicuspidata NRRL YB-4993]|uniref:Maintenance of mitochondrial morphology protein 1 n=1 Tax=Metschnikowia bicuspidata var. bicuspidata NRRL YB-4993 TaxID=869754 RepID=A0A1A0H633_9ASCO|nr:maintenance of mitochondrial morphology protein 1 [Metschnikowia bicuspidata var. bicuspidata NRRL YB-4993]OBA19367.1 maintenance of mitochondrial morphology protein 1 [Metschnikowia bicuspidata var. bicuspidata NRRL YB-4993]
MLKLGGPEAAYYIPASANGWSFTQGLVCGQLSVVVLVLTFIKFFVFSESPSSSDAARKSTKRDASGVIVKRDRKGKTEGSEDVSSTSKLESILEKTYYDVNNHNPESLDWFNVLVAQTISQLRTEALLADNIYHSLSEFLETLELPEFLDQIKLTEIDIGDDFPIFSNCRIKHNASDSGRLEAKIDVDLSDTLTLGIETRLLLNYPRPLTAILPVQLSVSMVRFSSCLTVSLVNTNDADFTLNSKDDSPGSGGTALMFSFSPDYRLEFQVKSLIGSRAKLQDVPKISELIENKLRAWFTERCIEPRFQVVKLPSMWPRSKNTREPVHANASGMVDKLE